MIATKRPAAPFFRAPRSLGALAGLAFLAIASCSEAGGPSGANGDVKVDPFIGDIVMGDPNAPVEIVEYASLTCPHCRDFWKQQFPVLKERYVDTGKARYILRDFPTPPVEVAAAGAAIARCKGKDKYYEIVDDIFSSYREMIEAAQSAQGAGPVLVAIGGRHGLSPDEVRACVNDPDLQRFFEKTVADAAGRVSSTPTLFVDDVVVENHTIENLTAAIEAKLNPGAAPPAPAQ
ncbi:MAG: thioredoxin domain-containing protein [Alphaproteobacteria bacterium]|nr:thioredoxin domain-containing protein [Alphaproteobacteria bacterium]